MLHHMNRAAAITGTPSVSYRTLAVSAAANTTYTFTNRDIGTANKARLVVLQVMAEGDSGDSVTTTSVTVAGFPAYNYINNTANRHNSLWAVEVQTGTTANIVVNVSPAPTEIAVAVYALYDLLSNVPIDVQGSAGTGTTASVTLAVQNKGIVIAGVITTGVSTWTGITERYQQVLDSSVYAGGDSVMVSTSSSYSVQATYSISQPYRLVAGSWR